MYSKPHGHNLVFVGTEFVKDTSATAIDALTVGQIGLYLPDGQGINTDPTSGNSVTKSDCIIAFGTGKTDFNGNALNEVSFPILADGANLARPYVNKDYTAPVLKVDEVTLTTLTVGDKVIVTVLLERQGSYSNLNYTHIYGEADVASGDDQEAVVDKLVISLNRNADTHKVPTVTASKNGTGASATLRITEQAQSVINFENNYKPIKFETTVQTATGDATALTITDPKFPFGYGPEVAIYEEFHRGAGAQWQWMNAPYKKARDLFADAGTNYDCLDIVLTKEKKNYGSNISLERKISVFIDQAATTGAPPALATSVEDLKLALDRVLYGYTKP